MNDKPTIKIGDIFLMSWGYDQTNVNFFQVTRLSKTGVFVREIGYKSVEGSQGPMCQSVIPEKDSFIDQSQWCSSNNQSFTGNVETFKKLKFYFQKPSFNFKGRYFAYLWNQTPAYNSWYA